MDLLCCMRRAVDAALPRQRAGVAFSGGLDSALLALLCRDAGRRVTALTVGMPGSPDLRGAPAAAAECGLELRTAEIADLEARLGPVQGRLSWAENAAAFGSIFELAARGGLGVVAAANGIDELFCGYDAFRREYAAGAAHLEGMMRSRLQSEIEMFGPIEDMARGLGVRLVQPFLSPDFAKKAMRVPLGLKVSGPGDMMRKHAVREAALRCGVPGRICARPKKALQYGSGIHRAALRAARARRRAAPTLQPTI